MSRPMDVLGWGAVGVESTSGWTDASPAAAMIAAAEAGTASVAQATIRGLAVGAMTAAAATMGTTTAARSSAGTAPIAAQAMAGACGARCGAGKAAMAADTTRGASDSRWSGGSAPTTSLTIGGALSGPPATTSCAAKRGALAGLLVTASIRTWFGGAGCAGAIPGAHNTTSARKSAAPPLGLSTLAMGPLRLPMSGNLRRKYLRRHRGTRQRFEPLHRCRQLAQALDAGVRAAGEREASVGVPAIAHLDRPHVGQVRAFDVKPRIVPHVHRVLGRYSQQPQRATKDVGVRLAQAALVREHHSRESMVESGFAKDAPQDGARGAQRVGDEADGDSALDQGFQGGRRARVDRRRGVERGARVGPRHLGQSCRIEPARQRCVHGLEKQSRVPLDRNVAHLAPHPHQLTSRLLVSARKLRHRHVNAAIVERLGDAHDALAPVPLVGRGTIDQERAPEVYRHGFDHGISHLWGPVA